MADRKTITLKTILCKPGQEPKVIAEVCTGNDFIAVYRKLIGTSEYETLEYFRGDRADVLHPYQIIYAIRNSNERHLFGVRGSFVIVGHRRGVEGWNLQCDDIKNIFPKLMIEYERFQKEGK